LDHPHTSTGNTKREKMKKTEFICEEKRSELMEKTE
jgi:hypothetical protein